MKFQGLMDQMKSHEDSILLSLEELELQEVEDKEFLAIERKIAEDENKTVEEESSVQDQEEKDNDVKIVDESKGKKEEVEEK